MVQSYQKRCLGLVSIQSHVCERLCGDVYVQVHILYVYADICV